jgi:hypothetical protein
MAMTWLRCRILKGMFSDEFAVEVSPPGGKPTSFFVSKKDVRGDIDQDGEVRVRVIRKGASAWALLPTETPVEIPIREADLVAL